MLIPPLLVNQVHWYSALAGIVVHWPPGTNAYSIFSCFFYFFQIASCSFLFFLSILFFFFFSWFCFCFLFLPRLPFRFLCLPSLLFLTSITSIAEHILLNFFVHLVHISSSSSFISGSVFFGPHNLAFLLTLQSMWTTAPTNRLYWC